MLVCMPVHVRVFLCVRSGCIQCEGAALSVLPCILGSASSLLLICKCCGNCSCTTKVWVVSNTPVYLQSAFHCRPGGPPKGAQGA
jgi:hypothetical protein